MPTEQIVIEYIAQVEGLKAQLKTIQTDLKSVEKLAKNSGQEIEKSYGKAGDTIIKVGKDIATSLGIAFSVAKVVQFAQESIKAFQEAEAVAKKLEFAITRIGKEGADAFEKLTKQADKLSKITIFDDESIKKAQTQLAQFGLQSKAIEKLLPQIIDLASATGKDLGEATDLAIAGINGQGRALKPYGIILDDTGNKTKNLAILTEGLTKFTGSAGEAFNTAAGQAQFFDNQINEIQESIGEKLTPAWQRLKFATLSSIDTQINQMKELFQLFESDSDEVKRKTSEFADASEKTQNRLTQNLIKKGEERTHIENLLLLEYHKILEKKRQSNKTETEQELGDTQKGIDDKLKAKEDELKQQLKLEDDFRKKQQEHFDHNEDVLKAKAEARKRDEFKKIDGGENTTLDLTGLNKLTDKDKKEQEDIADAQVKLFSEAANSLFEYKNQLADQELQNLQKNLDAGLISQENYDKKVADIKRKAAIRDKEEAVFNIILNTAVAVTKAFPNAILAGLVAALGAVELAAVLARPIPAFAEGVIDLKGGVKGKDSIPAILMPGESVMTTAETQRHGDLLRSIRKNNLDQYILENYVNPKLSAILGNSTVDNMARSAKLNGLDEYGMSRALRRNNGVNIQNSESLAKAIARELKGDNVKRTWS